MGASLVAQTVKNLPAVQETWVQSMGWEDPLEEGMATHSSILAWRIPRTEEPSKVYPWDYKESDMSDLHTQTMSLYIYTISSLSIHLSRILSLSIIITQVVKFLLILFYGNLQETSFKVIKSSLLRFVFCFVISVFFILRKSFSSEGLQNAHL